MKGSLIVAAMFTVGILVGYFDILPSDIDYAQLALYVLYLLIALVGWEFGYKQLSVALKEFDRNMIVLPVVTVCGSLGFAALAGWLLGGYRVQDYVALGSGLGYYSLSSMLILEYMRPTVGAEIAGELATIALLANMMREMLALLLSPLLKRLFGSYAPISAAGVTSLDVCLPAIARSCGAEMVPMAILHGVILEMSIPVLVWLCCL